MKSLFSNTIYILLIKINITFTNTFNNKISKIRKYNNNNFYHKSYQPNFTEKNNSKNSNENNYFSNTENNLLYNSKIPFHYQTDYNDLNPKNKKIYDSKNLNLKNSFKKTEKNFSLKNKNEDFLLNPTSNKIRKNNEILKNETLNNNFSKKQIITKGIINLENKILNNNYDEKKNTLNFESEKRQKRNPEKKIENQNKKKNTYYPESPFDLIFLNSLKLLKKIEDPETDIKLIHSSYIKKKNKKFRFIFKIKTKKYPIYYGLLINNNFDIIKNFETDDLDDLRIVFDLPYLRNDDEIDFFFNKENFFKNYYLFSNYELKNFDLKVEDCFFKPEKKDDVKLKMKKKKKWQDKESELLNDVYSYYNYKKDKQ